MSIHIWEMSIFRNDFSFILYKAHIAYIFLSWIEPIAPPFFLALQNIARM